MKGLCILPHLRRLKKKGKRETEPRPFPLWARSVEGKEKVGKRSQVAALAVVTNGLERKGGALLRPRSERRGKRKAATEPPLL